MVARHAFHHNEQHPDYRDKKWINSPDLSRCIRDAGYWSTEYNWQYTQYCGYILLLR